jgi:hypothetical protein
VISTRLLLRGGGSFPTPTFPEAFEILAAPNGAWPSWDAAFYDSTLNASLFGLVSDAGSVRIGQYLHATEAGSSVEVGVLSADQHNAPAVIRRSSDGRFVAAMSDHAGAAMYINISTNPDDNDPWAGTTNIDAQLGGSGYTYPFLAQLNDETGDPIYLFFRIDDGLSNWCYSTSTDGGTTWSAFTNLVFGTRYYARFVKTSESRIDMAITDGSYAEDFASVYHGYLEGGVWHGSDGTPLAGSAPYDITDFTLAYDGSTSGARIPNSIQSDGTRVAVAFPVFTGAPSGHIGTNGNYIVADWDGSTWTSHTLATAVGMTTFDFSEGGLALDPADLDHAAASIRVSGTWRMHDCVRADADAAWVNTQVTSSGDEDRYPWFVDGHQSPLLYIWQKGTFTSQSVFDVGVWGYGLR